MSTERVHRLARADNIDFIRRLFTAQIAGGELDLPVLPELAARAIAPALAEHMGTNSGSLAPEAPAIGPVATEFGFGLPGILALRGPSAAIRALVAGY